MIGFGELDGNDGEGTGIDGLLHSLGKVSPVPRGLKLESTKSISGTEELDEDPVNKGGLSIERERKLIPRNFCEGNKGESRREENDAIDNLLARNRTTLKKFEALSLGGRSLNNYTIGGYVIDVPKTVEQVKRIAPLPPNALPKIFLDDDLNFFHHFFRGMEQFLGVEEMAAMMSENTHYELAGENLAEKISEFMSEAMAQSDTSLTLLVKKVLSSTFEKSQVLNKSEAGACLKVVTNLWGFRYIEPGMIIGGNEIRMWLSSCYSYYRTLWFDTFKASGIPSFASEGAVMKYKMDKQRKRDDEFLETSTRELSSQMSKETRRLKEHTRVMEEGHFRRKRRQDTNDLPSWLKRSTR
jgi:hypothetical protein